MPLSIRLGQFALNLEASHVLNDPLEELIDWGQYVLDGTTGFRRVCFWLEPTGYALDVFAHRLDVVKVRISSDERITPPMTARPMTTELNCVVQRNLLATELHQALFSLFDSAQAEIREHWSEDEDLSRYERRFAVFSEQIDAV